MNVSFNPSRPNWTGCTPASHFGGLRGTGGVEARLVYSNSKSRVCASFFPVIQYCLINFPRDAKITNACHAHHVGYMRHRMMNSTKLNGLFSAPSDGLSQARPFARSLIIGPYSWTLCNIQSSTDCVFFQLSRAWALDWCAVLCCVVCAACCALNCRNAP